MVRFAMLVMMHRNKTQNAKNVLRVIVSLPANAYYAPLVRLAMPVMINREITRCVINVQKIISSLPKNAQHAPLVRRTLKVMINRGQTQNATPLYVLLMSMSSSNICTSCPPGTTNAAGDDASKSDTACDPTLCSANEHVVSHVCTTCPPGTSNAVGNHDASGPDTECDTNPSKKSFMLEYVWIGTGILGAVLSFFRL